MKNTRYLNRTAVGIVLACLLWALPVIAQPPATGTASETTTAENITAADIHNAKEGQTDAHEQPQTAPAVRGKAQQQASPGVWDFLTDSKYIAFLIVMIVAVILLYRRWVNRWVRIIMMLISFVLFGSSLVFALHPSPMCGLTKLFMFRFTLGHWLPGFLAMFIAMFLPSLIGRKLFCGWVCPLGALQDLINKIPFSPRFKQFNFTAFNSVRMFLLLLFVLTFFMVKDQIGMLGEQTGADTTNRMWVIFSAYNLYDPINFFELIHWHIDTIFIIMGILLVIGSLMLYRPFCYLICPIGAVSWLLERIAPGKIRIDHKKCNKCMACVAASPCPTIAKLIDEKTIVAPDCTSCGECIGTCNKDAIKFGFKD